MRDDELPLIHAWLEAFDRDLGLDDRTIPLRLTTDQARHFLAWTIDDRPVSMARAVRPFRSGWTIAAVYTPPEHRSRGYAGAVVHGLSERLLADGARFISLYTDVANPVSNRLYARIGFVPIHDQSRLDWSTP